MANNQGQPGQDGKGQGKQGQPGQKGQGKGSPQTARNGGSEGMFNNRGGGEETGPLTGTRYTEWSDRLREVEESIDSPDLKAEVARVRDAARAARVEFKRHSQEPQWDLVQAQIQKPLAEIRARVQQEIARKESKDALVPIDRDPVPGKFGELVRRYYEKLGGDN